MNRYMQLVVILLAASIQLHAQSDTLSFDSETTEYDSVVSELIVLDIGCGLELQALSLL
jgi:hypothetical protein